MCIGLNTWAMCGNHLSCRLVCNEVLIAIDGYPSVHGYFVT